MGVCTNTVLRRVRGLAALGLALAGGAGVIALSPSVAEASPGGTLYVSASTGHDTGTCRLQAHPCQTIAYALTQATQNSTIRVTSGSYPQQLVITGAVTIAGPTSGSPAVIDPSTLPTSDVDSDSSEPQNAIVDVQAGGTATLKNVTVNGSAAENSFSGCGVDYVGVYYHDASGALTNVKVTDIELPQSLFGCQDGLGVYVDSDGSATSNVTMSDDSVTAYDKNGITCDDAGTTCSVTGSVVTGIGPTGLIAQNGIQYYGAAAGTISTDTVSADSYTGNSTEATGLLLCDLGSLTVTNNTVSASDIDAYLCSDGSGPVAGTWTVTGNNTSHATPGGVSAGYGIYVDSTSNPITISHNTASNGTATGISLWSVSGATVENNIANKNGGDGIYIGGPGSAVSTDSTGNTVSNNTANKNTQDGIQADTESSSNTFDTNIVKKNLNFDLQDAGTSNTFHGNTCSPANDSNPTGLCTS